MTILEKDRQLAKVVLFWVIVVALSVALFFLIRSDHWGWKKEIYFSLRALGVVVIIQIIVWAIKVRKSRVE
jgi:hypothetical protein